MCSVCGCGQAAVTLEGPAPHRHDQDHVHDHGHVHAHGANHGHDHHHHDHDHDHDHTIPPTAEPRLVRIERDLLAANDAFAAANRRTFAAHGQFVLNLVSSPGSGKTTLLVRTVEMLKERFPVAVIEGDQQTSLDAERLHAAGVPAVQINTGKGCHLDAHMVGHALDRLPLDRPGALFIENVGNLVCPAAFGLGEAHKVVVLSVTEGEDKPLKYPDMFAASDVMILNKIDLLPYVSFDVERCIGYARRVNPEIKVFRLSATTGEGFQPWLWWIGEGFEAAKARAANNDIPG